MADRLGRGAGSLAVSGQPPGVVLDTNAWLDLLVFRDPVVARLDGAIRGGRVRAIVDTACRQELERVLAYRALALDAAQRRSVLDMLDSMSTCVAPPALVEAPPRCSDPDDQKFVDLALAMQASALLSRDDAVLRLAPRMRARGVVVATPAAWCAGLPADQISKR